MPYVHLAVSCVYIGSGPAPPCLTVWPWGNCFIEQAIHSRHSAAAVQLLKCVNLPGKAAVSDS